MSATSYIAAWKLLDGATDANGNTLRVDRIFMQDEASAAGGAIDYSNNNVNGTYSGSGVAYSQTDAKNLPSATSAVQAAYDGTGYLNAGTLPSVVDALDAEGFFYAGWITNSNRSTRTFIAGCTSATSGNGLRIEHNSTSGEFAQADNLAVFIYDSAGRRRGVDWRQTDQIFSDGLPHYVVIHGRVAGAGGAIRAGDFTLNIDGTDFGAYLSTADSPSAPQTCSTAGVAAMLLAGTSDSGSLFASGIIKTTGTVIGRGKPTQAQIDSILAAATYNYRGVPGCKFHIKSAANCIAATTGGTPALNPVANLGSIAQFTDQSGFGNNLIQATAANRMTRFDDDDGAVEADADNYYQSAAFGVDQKTQFAALTSGASGFATGHMWMVAVVRLTASSIYQQTAQMLMSVLNSTTHQFGVGIPNFGSSGADQVSAIGGAGYNSYAPSGANFPFARCTSLAVIGITRGEGGDPTACRVYMNRFASATASVPSTTVVSDAINLFGPSAGGLTAGRFREAAMGMGYLSPAKFLTVANAIMAEMGYTMNPTVHLRDFSDSTFTQKSTYNRGALMRFPSAIRKRISTCQASIGSQRMKHSVGGDAGVTDVYADRVPDSTKWGDTDAAGGVTSTAIDIGLLRAGRNDAAADGESAATISTEANAVLTKMATGGCTKRVISSLQSEVAVAAAYATLCTAKVGVNVDRAVILRDLTGKYAVDGFHLSDAGEQQVCEDLLAQALVPIAPGVFGGNHCGAMAARPMARGRGGR